MRTDSLETDMVQIVISVLVWTLNLVLDALAWLLRKIDTVVELRMQAPWMRKLVFWCIAVVARSLGMSEAHASLAGKFAVVALPSDAAVKRVSAHWANRIATYHESRGRLKLARDVRLANGLT